MIAWNDNERLNFPLFPVTRFKVERKTYLSVLFAVEKRKKCNERNK